MADRRINIAKDKYDFVQELVDLETKGIFKTKADVLTFCAAYGYYKNRRITITENAKDPIPYSVFENSKYDMFIHLLAMDVAKDADVLADNDDMIDKRATIFESYANGGLELLMQELKGQVEYLEKILLIIHKATQVFEDNKTPEDDFDLSSLTI
ncbi:DNA phosphorothioation-associated protein 4 [Methylomonas sp. MED-D]|uniref:DNA phosphorothioation-associated protein 4 n=1 Tax=Methylomonas sp. MED-D TaxID=3418768 RepID=UPI003CFD8A17